MYACICACLKSHVGTGSIVYCREKVFFPPLQCRDDKQWCLLSSPEAKMKPGQVSNIKKKKKKLGRKTILTGKLGKLLKLKHRFSIHNGHATVMWPINEPCAAL